MANKIIARVVQKHDTEANWNKAKNFIPNAGEFIVYDKDSNYDYTRIKIGDGITKVVDLPFFTIKEDWVTPEIGMSVEAFKFIGTQEVMQNSIQLSATLAAGSLLANALNSTTANMTFMFSGPSINDVYPIFTINNNHTGEITSHTPTVSMETQWGLWGDQINGRYSWSELGITSLTITDLPENEVNLFKILKAEANPVIVDSELSETSENPVQNKIITQEFNTRVGNTSVPEQIQTAIEDYAASRDLQVYVQDIEPIDAPSGAIWFDTSTVSALMAEEVEF